MPDTISDTGRVSVVDYAALPGPGGRKSLIPPVDARWWTLKVALSQRPWSFLASAGMAVSFVCNGVTPVVVGRAVDDAIAASSFGRLGFWISVLAGVFAVAIVANWTARFMLVRSQQLVSHDLRTLVTDRIQDPRGIAGRERTPGGLLSIATSDTNRVGDIVMMTVMPVAELASILYGAAVMFTIDPWLSLGVLVGGPLLAVVALRVARPLQSRSVARQQAIAEAAATATDVVHGLRILKGLGAIVTVRGRYDAVSDVAYSKTVHANGAEARLNGATDAAGALFVSVLGLTAGALALNGHVSVGELITVVGLTQFLVTPMTMFGRNLASRWAAAEASGSRIREILGADVERPSELEAERAEAVVPAVFAAPLEEQLETETDSQERLAGIDRLQNRPGQPEPLDFGDRVFEGSHARQNKLGCPADRLRVACHRGGMADLLEPLLHAPQIAHSVVDDRDHEMPIRLRVASQS